MALIECTDCGGRVSDKASACPHCGAAILQLGADSHSPADLPETIPEPAAPAVVTPEPEPDDLGFDMGWEDTYSEDTASFEPDPHPPYADNPSSFDLKKIALYIIGWLPVSGAVGAFIGLGLFAILQKTGFVGPHAETAVDGLLTAVMIIIVAALPIAHQTDAGGVGQNAATLTAKILGALIVIVLIAKFALPAQTDEPVSADAEAASEDATDAPVEEAIAAEKKPSPPIKPTQEAASRKSTRHNAAKGPFATRAQADECMPGTWYSVPKEGEHAVKLTVTSGGSYALHLLKDGEHKQHHAGMWSLSEGEFKDTRTPYYGPLFFSSGKPTNPELSTDNLCARSTSGTNAGGCSAALSNCSVMQIQLHPGDAIAILTKQ
jgi:hypothetical protein